MRVSDPSTAVAVEIGLTTPVSCEQVVRLDRVLRHYFTVRVDLTVTRVVRIVRRVVNTIENRRVVRTIGKAVRPSVTESTHVSSDYDLVVGGFNNGFNRTQDKKQNYRVVRDCQAKVTKNGYGTADHVNGIGTEKSLVVSQLFI